jgi:hypothetical protein
MSNISIDKQIIEQICPNCQSNFSVCRGSVYDESKPIAIYLVALHSCNSNKLADMAIAIKNELESLEKAFAITLNIISTEKEYQVSIIEPQDSLWYKETYLGTLLKREEAREHPLRELFFHITDHIVLEIPEINNYFEDE